MCTELGEMVAGNKVPVGKMMETFPWLPVRSPAGPVMKVTPYPDIKPAPLVVSTTCGCVAALARGRQTPANEVASNETTIKRSTVAFLITPLPAVEYSLMIAGHPAIPEPGESPSSIQRESRRLTGGLTSHFIYTIP
jgi:hypothetical protein